MVYQEVLSKRVENESEFGWKNTNFTLYFDPLTRTAEDGFFTGLGTPFFSVQNVPF